MSKQPSESEDRPSLLQRESRGGDVAGGGLSFQESVVMSYIPTWLSDEGFVEMTHEAMGDAEARFWVPGRGYARELIEVKDRRLTPALFWEEIDRFQELEGGSPDTYYRFVLIGKELSAPVGTVRSALRRVRDPYSFYEGTAIARNSFDEYAAVVKNLGRPEADAKFLFEKVWIRDDLTTDEDQWRAVFEGELLVHFPEYADLSHKTSQSIYEGLADMVKRHRSKTLSRLKIERKIEERIPEANRPPKRPVVLNTATCDSTRANQYTAPDIRPLRLEWEGFFGGAGRSYPPPGEWDRRLVGELEQAKAWILANRTVRRIRLTGNRRLSASLATGAVFSAVSGFAIEMENRGGEVWATDAHPAETTPEFPLQVVREFRASDHLVVSIGIGKDVAGEVEQSLGSLGLSDLPKLHLISSAPLRSAEHANKAAGVLKEAMTEALVQCGAGCTHLFFAGPSSLALFLGHRLNATAPVRCYEWVARGKYVPTCELI